MRIKRGEVWLLNLEPVVGSEIAKTRPALVISRSDYNEVAETVTVIPVSKGRYLSSLHVYLADMEAGSHAVIPQIRVASKQRFIKKITQVSDLELSEIREKMQFYLEVN